MKKFLPILIFAILFSIPKISYAVVLFDGNYYDLIQGSTTWNNAKTSAENLTYLGMPSHLATITSSAENAFLNTTFNTGQDSQFAWIGGWEPADDGVWR